MKSRILRACEKAKKIESMKFSEKELRGLSKPEKEFIRCNNYNVCINCRITVSGDPVKLYLFIAKQMNGRKALYAYTKKQSINPNGHDISREAYNYECWLMFDRITNGFSKFSHERRFCKMGNAEIIIFA